MTRPAVTIHASRKCHQIPENDGWPHWSLCGACPSPRLGHGEMPFQQPGAVVPGTHVHRPARQDGQLVRVCFSLRQGSMLRQGPKKCSTWSSPWGEARETEPLNPSSNHCIVCPPWANPSCMALLAGLLGLGRWAALRCRNCAKVWCGSRLPCRAAASTGPFCN